MSSPIHENAFIERLTAAFPRSPHQLNRLQESDAELVRLPADPGTLAITTDSIVEELESGLYTDPYQIGWMTVLVNASDLAAVGAEPVGILLDLTFPPDLPEAALDELRRGLRDAAEAAELPVLGGDTNFSDRLRVGATAVGRVPAGDPLTRRGCRPGDRVFASGPLGWGAGWALERLAGEQPPAATTAAFLPRPRLAEGQLARRFASAAIDTSDGALAALDQLARVNQVGFEIDAPEEAYLDARARAGCRARELPAWWSLAGPHGEFELILTVPDALAAAFVRAAVETGWSPVPLGTVGPEPGVRLRIDGSLRDVDAGRVRNLFAEAGGDPSRYLELLSRHHRDLVTNRVPIRAGGAS